MAVCVGCGLNVTESGVLEVALCPNGGIKCATTAVPSPDGCTDGLYIDQVIGCGLKKSADGRTLSLNVQGQTDTVPLATARTTCPSPNCNGLVCTDEGLWAPPKTYGTYSFSFDQDGAPAGPINSYLVSIPGGIPDLPNSVGDGRTNPSLDQVVTNNPNYQLLFHSFDVTDALDCGLQVYGNTFSTFNLSMNVQGGETWRFLLWERVATNPTITAANMNGPATIAGSPLNGTGWALQASFYVDRFNDPVVPGGYLESFQMNDTSSTGGGNGVVRWEYMITANRLNGTGPANNNTISATRQYRLTLNTAHCRPPEGSSNAQTPGPIVTFP